MTTIGVFGLSSWGNLYLINDCLVFYDSRVLYICGFPFQKITQELTTKHIRSILDAKRNFSKAEGIRIWGRYVASLVML